MLIADFPPEPMAPFTTRAGAEGNIGRFRARFGPRYHSIAFYSTEIATAYERFRSRGVRLMGDGGGLLDSPPSRGAIYTHPRDTYGLIEIMEPRIAGRGGAPVGDVLGECYDPRLLGTHDPGWWEREHPLGIRRTCHLSVLVDDVEAASNLYGAVLDGRPFQETHDGADRIFMLVGTDTVVELHRPAAGTEEADHLDREGGMLWSVTFLVTDLERASDHLRATGTVPVTSEARDPHSDGRRVRRSLCLHGLSAPQRPKRSSVRSAPEPRNRSSSSSIQRSLRCSSPAHTQSQPMD